jgi:hypothetical protein
MAYVQLSAHSFTKTLDFLFPFFSHICEQKLLNIRELRVTQGERNSQNDANLTVLFPLGIDSI